MDALLSDAADAPRVCVCGPMVRASTLPLRLLVREYGGTLVWTEELVGLKLRGCTATRGADGLTTFVDAKGAPALVVDEAREAGRLVCQLGVADEASALAAAAVVAPVAAAIEINMGCPKRFSLQAGMGAALLKDAPRAARIVRALASSTSPVLPPVFVKMRLLESAAATLDFMCALLDAGARLITLHARRVGTPPTELADWATACEVAAALGARVAPRRAPLLLNGDGFAPRDVRAMLRFPHFRGVMLARGVLANASIFGALAGDGGGDDGGARAQLRPLGEVLRGYTLTAARVANPPLNTKYVACAMLKEAGHALPPALQSARSDADIAAAVRAWDEQAVPPPKPRLTSALSRARAPAAAAAAPGGGSGSGDSAGRVPVREGGGGGEEAARRSASSTCGGGGGGDDARARTPPTASASATPAPATDADADVDAWCGGGGAAGVAGVKRARAPPSSPPRARPPLAAARAPSPSPSPAHAHDDAAEAVQEEAEAAGGEEGPPAARAAA